MAKAKLPKLPELPKLPNKTRKKNMERSQHLAARKANSKGKKDSNA